MILSGATGKENQVPHLGRNGHRKESEVAFPWIFAFSAVCSHLTTKGYSSGWSSWWYYWQSAECVHRECYSNARLFLYWKSRNKVPALHQKRCDFLTVRNAQSVSFELFLCHETVNGLSFSRITWNLAAGRLLIAPALLICILLDASSSLLCSSVISQSWKDYYLFWQSPTYFVKQYITIAQLTGVDFKSFSSLLPLWVRLLYLLSCLPLLKEAQYIFWLIFLFVATFQ